MNSKSKKTHGLFLRKLLLLVVAVFLFVFSHPNAVFICGFGALGFFALLPVFLLVKKSNIFETGVWGFFYGAFCYVFYCHWLFAFHPITIFIVFFVYGLILSFVFVATKLASLCFGKWDFLFFPFVWTVYEYLKTQGFLGFGYGILGYTQWQFVPFIFLSQYTGVWGISFLLAFFSSIAQNIILQKRLNKTNISCLFVWGAVFFSIVIAGLASEKSATKKEARLPKANIIAVQENVDPWKTGVENYQKDLNLLISLTEGALQKTNNPCLVVWSETAITPGIVHNYEGNDLQRKQLVCDLLDYIDTKKVAFVIGNDHIEYERNEESAESEKGEKKGRKDYNAACVFLPKCNTHPPLPVMYFKKHLVPFTEHFPYSKLFPKFNQMLLSGDTHFWLQGKDDVVFNVELLQFATPICFEDTFGIDCAKMVQKGARQLINLSNDAWSRSLVCQKQHLAMSVFRAKENCVPVIRASSTGQTCYISTSGRVIEEAPPFCSTYCAFCVPIQRVVQSEQGGLGKKTGLCFYTNHPDVFAKAILVFVLLSFFVQFARMLSWKMKTKSKM